MNALSNSTYNNSFAGHMNVNSTFQNGIPPSRPAKQHRSSSRHSKNASKRYKNLTCEFPQNLLKTMGSQNQSVHHTKKASNTSKMISTSFASNTGRKEKK